MRIISIMDWRILLVVALLVFTKVYLMNYAGHGKNEGRFCGLIFNTCKYHVETKGPINLFAPAEVNLTYPVDKDFTFSVIAYHPFVFTDVLLCYEAESDVPSTNNTNSCHEIVLPRNGLGATEYRWHSDGDITINNVVVVETLPLKVVNNVTKISVLYVPRGTFIRFPTTATNMSVSGHPSRLSIDIAKFVIVVLIIGMIFIYVPSLLQMANQVRTKSNFRYQRFTNSDRSVANVV